VRENYFTDVRTLGYARAGNTSGNNLSPKGNWLERQRNPLQRVHVHKGDENSKHYYSLTKGV